MCGKKICKQFIKKNMLFCVHYLKMLRNVVRFICANLILVNIQTYFDLYKQYMGLRNLCDLHKEQCAQTKHKSTYFQTAQNVAPSQNFFSSGTHIPASTAFINPNAEKGGLRVEHSSVSISCTNRMSE